MADAETSRHKPTEMLQPLTHPHLDQEGGGGVTWELTPGEPGQVPAKHSQLLLVFTSPASGSEPFQNEAPSGRAQAPCPASYLPGVGRLPLTPPAQSPSSGQMRLRTPLMPLGLLLSVFQVIGS